MECWGTRTLSLVLLLLLCIYGVESRYRGGARYSGYRASRSYRAYYSSYRSYRSYVSVRYTRAYAAGALASTYFYYHNLYFYHSAAYSKSHSLSASTEGVCKNYEANSNGSYMGLFVCPLSFEPSDFTACCGKENAEYCCKWNDNVGNVVGVVFGAIIGAAVIIVLIIIVVRCCKVKKMKVGSSTNVRRRDNRQEINSVMRAPPAQRQVTYGYNQPPPPNQNAHPSFMFYSGAQQSGGFAYNDPVYPPSVQNPGPAAPMDPGYNNPMSQPPEYGKAQESGYAPPPPPPPYQ